MYILLYVNLNSIKLLKTKLKGALNNQFPIPHSVNKQMLWTTPENVENFKRKKLSELGKKLETTKLMSVFFNCETLNDISYFK